MGSGNGLSPIRRQAIIRTNAAILSIRPQGTHFSEILFKIRKFSFKKMHFKISSAKRRPFCLGLSVLMASRAVRLLLGARWHDAMWQNPAAIMAVTIE